MAQRKVRDRRDARECLEAVETSGMTLRAWANAHGVDGRSLHAWQINLARGASPARSAPRRVPPLVELVPTPRLADAEGARYRILCGELAVEVDAEFDESVLRRLLAVVASC